MSNTRLQYVALLRSTISIEVRMLLLKGYGLSKYYPVPSLCLVGDIDIYLCHL